MPSRQAPTAWCRATCWCAERPTTSSIFPLIVSEVIASISNGMLLPVVLGPLVRAYQAYDAPDTPREAAPAIHA